MVFIIPPCQRSLSLISEVKLVQKTKVASKIFSDEWVGGILNSCGRKMNDSMRSVPMFQTRPLCNRFSKLREIHGVRGDIGKAV